MNIEKYMRVNPIPRKDGRVHTGFGFVLDIVDTNNWILERGITSDPKSYKICTDFGNIVTYTREELRSSYTLGEVDEPKSRILRQIDKLMEVYNTLE